MYPYHYSFSSQDIPKRPPLHTCTHLPSSQEMNSPLHTCTNPLLPSLKHKPHPQQHTSSNRDNPPLPFPKSWQGPTNAARYAHCFFCFAQRPPCGSWRKYSSTAGTAERRGLSRPREPRRTGELGGARVPGPGGEGSTREAETWQRRR